MQILRACGPGPQSARRSRRQRPAAAEKLEDPSKQRLRDNHRYRATSPGMAGCHPRERRVTGIVRFPVIWQLRARGRNGPSAMCCPSTHPPATSTTSSLTWPTRTSRATDPRLPRRPDRLRRPSRRRHRAVVRGAGGAFLGEIAGQAPSIRKRKRAAVASFCKWAVRHEICWAPARWTASTPSGSQDAAPAGGRRRRRGGAGCDLLPSAAQGRAGQRAAGPGAVRRARYQANMPGPSHKFDYDRG